MPDVLPMGKSTVAEAAHLYDKPWNGNTSVALDELEKGPVLVLLKFIFTSLKMCWYLLKKLRIAEITWLWIPDK